MSKKQNDGGPAFPISFSTVEWHTGNVNVGMTLRDWFAGMAMQGMLAEDGRWDLPVCAEVAYEQADEMLKARGSSRDTGGGNGGKPGVGGDSSRDAGEVKALADVKGGVDAALVRRYEDRIELVIYPGGGGYSIGWDRVRGPEDAMWWVRHLVKKRNVTKEHLRAFLDAVMEKG